MRQCFGCSPTNDDISYQLGDAAVAVAAFHIVKPKAKIIITI